MGDWLLENNRSDKKVIALYIDTSALFSGKVFDMDSYIYQLKRLINLLTHNDNLHLLKNDILDLEIGDKFQLPQLNQHLTAEQIQKINKIFEGNKAEYQKTVYDLFHIGKDLTINVSHDEIIEGCKREYGGVAPWNKKKKKNNEWKDYFVQKTLLNYREQNLCDELIILCDDKDFHYMKNKKCKIDVRSGHLKEFIEFIIKYLRDGTEDFESYLINEIYLLEEYIVQDIESHITAEKGCHEIETIIEEVKLIDASDRDSISFEVISYISTTDFTHATYDKEDNQYWGLEECNFKVRCEFYAYFDGEYIDDNNFLGKVSIEGMKTIETI